LAEGPFGRVVATDVSPAALDVARRNAEADGLAARLDLRHGPTFSAVATGERFDVIVSNPPYVAEAQRGGLAPEIVDWEPAVALFGGPDGLQVIREIVRGALPLLAPGGLLALEVGMGQAAEVAELTEKHGLVDARVRKDLAGRARVVLANVPSSTAGTADIRQRGA
jgi:release factor glutamine methyltransferase